MRDFGRSDDPRVQAQLDRLATLSLPQGRLGLDTIRALMERLGNPHRKLPPVFHVAGTNGKGSTCAFLRAMLEAEGYKVHVTTSPHLVRYNERIRLAGELISDAMLAEVLGEVLDAGEDLGPSFFEVTIAAAFLAFSRVPADACVVEVGMGGRFDATNVLEPEALAACGIAALGLDHERFLLAPDNGVPTEPMARIAFEKAGIAKNGVPLVTIPQPDLEMQAITDVASWIGAPLHVAVALPGYQLGILGHHQIANASLAVAMVQQQKSLTVSDEAVRTGLLATRWPARLQYLQAGPLTRMIESCDWLLDGGHNVQAADALARHFEAHRIFRQTGSKLPRYAIIGLLDSKDWRGFIDRIASHVCALVAVPVPGHDSASPLALAAYAFSRGVPIVHTSESIEAAAHWHSSSGRPGEPKYGEVIIAGSLYLAGEALRLNDELPD
ncbi:MAG: folylpolyglutamate synthase/dihydrofolate synthase family protein [Erythrobacter sp.]|jgi:dihydrofolate synthase/folylpolyglutamate synthase|nr:folylpolyglutamate synthase/dihydrofolate synthase family protein [Erythrobacter sp.]